MKRFLFFLPVLIAFFQIAVSAIDQEAIDHYKKAYQLTEADQLESAEKELLLALEKEKDYSDVYRELGYLYYRRHQYQQALVNFRKNIALNPQDFAGLNGVGAVYSSLDLPVLAVEVLENALSLNPDYPVTHYNLAVAYYQTGVKIDISEHLIDKALYHFTKYVSLVSDASLRPGDRQFISRLRQMRSSISVLALENQNFLKQKVYQLNNWFAQYLSEKERIHERLDLGVLLAGLNEQEEALKEFENVLSSDKNNIHALSFACFIYFKQGNLSRYDQLLTRLKVINPKVAQYLKDRLTDKDLVTNKIDE